MASPPKKDLEDKAKLPDKVQRDDSEAGTPQIAARIVAKNEAAEEDKNYSEETHPKENVDDMSEESLKVRMEETKERPKEEKVIFHDPEGFDDSEEEKSTAEANAAEKSKKEEVIFHDPEGFDDSEEEKSTAEANAAEKSKKEEVIFHDPEGFDDSEEEKSTAEANAAENAGPIGLEAITTSFLNLAVGYGVDKFGEAVEKFTPPVFQDALQGLRNTAKNIGKETDENQPGPSSKK